MLLCFACGRGFDGCVGRNKKKVVVFIFAPERWTRELGALANKLCGKIALQMWTDIHVVKPSAEAREYLRPN